MSRRLLAAVLIAGVAAGVAAAVPGRPASAHGGCTAKARAPAQEKRLIWGSGRYGCGENHARLVVRVCLQKKAAEGWRRKDCERHDSGDAASGVVAGLAVPCAKGWWRTRARGRAFARDGSLVHTDRDVSERVRVRRCPGKG